MKEKEAKEFRTSYDGLLHPADPIPVDEFGEPIVGEVVRRAVEIHAETHEVKIAKEPAPEEDEEDQREKIKAHLRELAEGG